MYFGLQIITLSSSSSSSSSHLLVPPPISLQHPPRDIVILPVETVPDRLVHVPPAALLWHLVPEGAAIAPVALSLAEKRTHLMDAKLVSARRK